MVAEALVNKVRLLSANWKKCYLEKWLPTCFLPHTLPADAGALGLGGLDAVLAIRTCLISPEKMGEDACIVLLICLPFATQFCVFGASVLVFLVTVLKTNCPN